MKTLNFLFAFLLCFSGLCFISCEENGPEITDDGTTVPGDGDDTDPDDGDKDDNWNNPAIPKDPAFLVTSIYGNYNCLYNYVYDSQNRLISLDVDSAGTDYETYRISYSSFELKYTYKGKEYDYKVKFNEKGYINLLEKENEVYSFTYDGDYLTKAEIKAKLIDDMFGIDSVNIIYRCFWENGNLVKKLDTQVCKDADGSIMDDITFYDRETLIDYQGGIKNTGIYIDNFRDVLNFLSPLTYGGFFGKATAELQSDSYLKYDKKGRIYSYAYKRFAYEGEPLDWEVNPAVPSDRSKLVSSIAVKGGESYKLEYDDLNRMTRFENDSYIGRIENFPVVRFWFGVHHTSSAISTTIDNGFYIKTMRIVGVPCEFVYDGDYLVKRIYGDEVTTYNWNNGDLTSIVVKNGDTSKTVYFNYDGNSQANSGIYLPQMYSLYSVYTLGLLEKLIYPVFYSGLLGKPTARIPSSVAYSDKTTAADITVYCDSKGRIIRYFEDGDLQAVYAYDGNEAVWPE